MPLLYEIGLFYVIPFIVLTVLTEVEFFGWASIEVFAFAAFLGVWHHTEVLGFVTEHAGLVAKRAGEYIGIGIIWSYVKWGLYLYGFRGEFRAAKIKFLLEKGLDEAGTIPPELMAEFRAIGSWARGYKDITKRPLAIDHKPRIIAWMSLWPCSMVGFVLNNPIRRLFTYIFTALRGTYQHISNKILSDVEFDERKIVAKEKTVMSSLEAELLKAETEAKKFL